MTDNVAPTSLDAEVLLDLDPGGIKLIEASAGTGKTHTIADLYLRHILAGRQPSQILIVTYTNAATEELRGRIRRRLYDALGCLQNSASAGDEFLALVAARWRNLDEDARDLQLNRLRLALRSMDEAAISTIHSFCQRSLQDNAITGNQFYDSELLSSDDPIWEDAIKDWWRRQTYHLDRENWQLFHENLPQIPALTSILLELRNRPLAKLLPETTMSVSDLMSQPRAIARALHGLAPLWRRQQREIVDIVSASKALSRSKTLPYHPQNLDGLIEAADSFFADPDPAAPFKQFEYLASDFLSKNTKPSMRGKDPGLQHPFFKAIDPVARSWIEFTSTIKPRLLSLAFGWTSQKVLQAKRALPALAFQDQLTLLLEALESERGGEALAQSLRQQYPVAMIDEFQDTDTIQYRIFRLIYPHSAAGSLTLIGDPKQAIYSFRGGDIFTYMQARHLPDIQLFSLQTNWRSQPELVSAINHIFTQRQDAFIYRDSIEFTRIASIPENGRYRLMSENGPSAALTLWQLPQNEQGGNFSREQMRDLINRAIVAEIMALITNSDNRIDGQPVQSGAIAILVRQASEGQALSQALHRHGIRTVTIGRDSVFQCDEAYGLYDLLMAVAQFQDPVMSRRSLSSSLLGLDYREIAALCDDDDAWQAWTDDLGDLRELWERHGFISMFQALLHRFQVTRHLAQQDKSERRITNLLHLAELLHQQSTSIAGITPLLGWFRDQFEEAARDEVELRLENDEALVRIVTVHKAKGLQYPIVFVPFLWSCKPVDRNRAVYFHDLDLSPCIDLGSSDLERNWYLAEKERLAEDIRLLYVALTRARARVYLAWGLAGSPARPGYARQTALAYLLHSRQSPGDLESSTVDGFPSDMDFVDDLRRLVDRAGGTIELAELPVTIGKPRTIVDDSAQDSTQLATFSRASLPRWRINSFSGLTRGIHQPASLGALQSQGDAILDFPAGSHIGLLLHALLENLDFQQDIEDQCRELLPELLRRAGISAETHRDTLMRWLSNIIHTPLDGKDLSLRVIGRERRLNELGFDFALDHLDIDELNRFLQSLAPVPLQPVSGFGFSGLITGVIDLVFEYEGRYYLADYKSNFLGTSLEDYLPAKLEQAMLDRRYDLQSLVYSVALHRYLGHRLSDYDYDRHFGGSYYLFLRAMRPRHGNRQGIHFHRPPRKMLQALENLLHYTPLESLRA